MLFLLNDTVLRLDRAELRRPHRHLRCGALSPAFVLQLGREMFARAPLLHRASPVRARRLATLIRARLPDINAALFCAPAEGCAPDAVDSRTAFVSPAVLGRLKDVQEVEGPVLTEADRAVWRRLAA